MTVEQRRVWVLMCGALIPGSALANNTPAGHLDTLKRMSFEELMTVEITSVSRTEESLRDAAAAVAVISPEDIRRSGATTLPDALRLVPGIHVGEQTSSSWAVSSRGFSSITSEKLLVLSDTRSIYTPLFFGCELERAGLSARGHRARRSHPRPGRGAVGLQRGERRDQHHHPQCARHPWHPSRGRAPARSTAPGSKPAMAVKPAAA